MPKWRVSKVSVLGIVMMALGRYLLSDYLDPYLDLFGDVLGHYFTWFGDVSLWLQRPSRAWATRGLGSGDKVGLQAVG